MNRLLSVKWKEFYSRNKKSGGYLLRKKVCYILYRIIRAILLFGLCFLILQPLMNKISLSFMKERDLYDPTIIVVPRNFTTENYKLVNQLIGFWRAFGNSIGISLLVSVIQVAFCTLVGYGFARFQFPLKRFWFACVVLVIVVPPQTIMSSLYLNFRFFDIFGLITLVTGSTINLQKSIVPYLLLCMTCMGLKSGLYIFLIRQYFRGIPKELEEAAYVDGCGNFNTFIKIMLPDAKPILISCFLFAFVWQWTDAFYSKMFIGNIALISNKLTSISGLLNDYLTSINGTATKASVAYGQMMISTGMIMAIIPLLLLYIIAQKGFVENLSQTGLKM
ncbi:transporter [Anaerocolumna cellulosilytica]|uniref:Transporter n=1 Tax=Anaerocolumna cellulosilytica TaxID=433286 RepID=A0A6S6QRP8_9FIRM|nr:carbohydrate ABC transporter permease [Anaerocolumna cellulosilytica]MBB5197215.1 multiple sugar transport system permease protein [Anaerocolumna cellulosilytica]BCJ94023.1 transporter [Anaerocolumna cellulosilytica]